jgi:hypothetical protein
MSNEQDGNGNKSETRMMLGFSAGVVFLILAMMGANKLFHHPSDAEMRTDYSAQSRTVEPK